MTDHENGYGLDTDSLPDEFLSQFVPRLTNQIEIIEPDDDVDDYVPDSAFRIERMDADGIWLCAYTSDPTLPDIHYDISVTDTGELRVTRRVEPTHQTDQ